MFDAFALTARQKRATFVKVVAACLLAFIIAPPIAEAAAQRIKGTVTAKMKDSGGGTVSASPIGSMGLFEAAGSSGAVDVRNFAGGGGVLGAADCAAATPLENAVSVTNAVVTGVIITGTNATFTATAQAFGNHALPLLNWEVSQGDSNVFVGLGNGLSITTELKITCTAGTNGNLIVVGQ